MIGVVFPAEGDAKNFYKQVSNRKEIKRTSFARIVASATDTPVPQQKQRLQHPQRRRA